MMNYHSLRKFFTKNSGVPNPGHSRGDFVPKTSALDQHCLVLLDSYHRALKAAGEPAARTAPVTVHITIQFWTPPIERATPDGLLRSPATTSGPIKLVIPARVSSYLENGPASAAPKAAPPLPACQLAADPS